MLATTRKSPVTVTVSPVVREPGLPGLVPRDDPGRGQERVGERGLAVVHVGDDAHVAQVAAGRHERAELGDGVLLHLGS